MAEYNHVEMLSNLELARKLDAKIMELSRMMSGLLAPCLLEVKNPERTTVELQEMHLNMPLCIEKCEMRRLMNARNQQASLERMTAESEERSAARKAMNPPKSTEEQIKDGLVEALKA